MSHNILYISASSKPEELSTSKIVGRYMINQLKEKYSDANVEELDLYQINLPLVNYKVFTSRATLPSPEEIEKLSDQEKQDVIRINELCEQFIKADQIIISAPMWNMFFPSILKQYLDCIIIQGKLIDITPKSAKGLLFDKERKMIYIQSSGGCYPYIVSWMLNMGAKYLEDVFGFLGVSYYKNILVEGVSMDKVGKDQAIEFAKEDVDHILKRF